MEKLLRKTFCGVLALAFALLGFSTAHAYTYTDLNDMSLVNYTDAWNIDPPNVAGNAVDSSSSTIGNPGFGPNRTFGFIPGGGDANGNTIFSDGTDTKFITWHTSGPITLYGVNLFASLDRDGDTVTGRAISNFSLFYSLDAGASWTAIIDDFATGVATGNQGAYSVVIPPSAWGMAANFSFDPVTASYFKAEFTQLTYSGARVVELDAITSVVPIPGALWLLGSGLLGLGGWRRFRKN